MDANDRSGASTSAAAITELLERVEGGDREAASALLPLVYGELRRLAAARLARLPPGRTLQPTALVHEAYIELVGRGDPGWSGRGHFFAAAAHAMHDVVVDAARRKLAVKRGGGARHADVAELSLADSPELPAEDVLDVARALEALAAAHPRRAEVATMRVFAGATEEEIAHALGTSVRTVEREWRFARAWLHRELERR